MDLRSFFAFDETSVNGGRDEGLLAGVAHDLSNRLVPARLLVEALRDDPQLPASCRERVRLMEQSLELAAGLSRKLVAYLGGDGSAPIRLDTGGMLSDVRRTIRVASGSVEPEIDPVDVAPWVSAEPRRLLLLLLVATKAAYDLLATGGREGTVRIAVSGGGDGADVELHFNIEPQGAEPEGALSNGAAGTGGWEAALDALRTRDRSRSVLPLELGEGPERLESLAESHGGRVSTSTLSAGGCRLTLTLPSIPAPSSSRARK